MKYILLIIGMITLWLLLSHVTKFDERTKAMNKYNCAVMGYYEDCKTQLSAEDRLK